MDRCASWAASGFPLPPGSPAAQALAGRSSPAANGLSLADEVRGSLPLAGEVGCQQGQVLQGALVRAGTPAAQALAGRSSPAANGLSLADEVRGSLPLADEL